MIAAVLCVCVTSAWATGARDAGTRGHGNPGTRGRDVYASLIAPAAADYEPAGLTVLAAAPAPRFRERSEAARFPVSPCRRVPVSAWNAPTAMRRLGGSEARPPAAGEDPWFAEDKLKHFLLSFAVTSMGYAMARTAGLTHDGAIAGAAGAGAAAGIWKELHDRATGGDVSARDLTWDAAGIATGGVLAAHTR